MHPSVELSTGISIAQYVTYHNPELYRGCCFWEPNGLVTVLEYSAHVCFAIGDELLAAESVFRSHTACLDATVKGEDGPLTVESHFVP